MSSVIQYSTSAKAIIHSHNNAAPISIFEDIVSVSLSRTLKGTGKANLSLVPGENYLNLIHPNDYINIYFNKGDEDGWVRSFFGFVDRIEETYEVDVSGKPSTFYTIVCSDFTKAIAKTFIYFNPNMAGRIDFQGDDISAPNIGGLALLSRGIQIMGTPPDLVVDLILVLLGFQTQFVLPKSLIPIHRSRLRELTSQYLMGRVTDNVRSLFNDPERFDQALMKAKDEANQDVESRVSGANGQPTDRNFWLTQSRDEAGIPDSVDSQEDYLSARASSNFLRDELGMSDAQRSLASSQDFATRELFARRTSDPGSSVNSLLDLMDIHTFVERTAIDGYTGTERTIQDNVSLLSQLRYFSHEHMNELFFDLRAMPNSEDGSLVSGTAAYSRDRDDISGNVDFEDSVPSGVCYVPSLVMREYPFATVEGVDAGELAITQNSANFGVVGSLYFGAIFSGEPNRPGRHLVVGPNINVYDKFVAPDTAPSESVKHLDVVVVSDAEIMKTAFGRSDHELFNLFEFGSDSILGSDEVFFLMDILPIISPVQIARHGLRLRRLRTSFDRVDVRAGNAESTERPEPPAAPTVVSPGTLVAPIEFGVTRLTPTGYRRNTADGVPVWKYHNGADLYATEGKAVSAIMDGTVVARIPSGYLSHYGNVVIIKHTPEQSGMSETLYSFYAHLNNGAAISASDSSFAFSGSNALNLTTREIRRGLQSHLSADVRTAGVFDEIQVTAGTTIGAVGSTAGTPSNPARSFTSSAPHLHMEIIKARSSGNGLQYPTSASAPAAVPREPDDRVPPADPGNTRMMSPTELYNLRSVDITGAEALEEEVEDTECGDTADSPDQTELTASAPTGGTSTQSPQSEVGNLDTSKSRRQLIRWAILQDHWYQHNLEYLSGTIQMRGAPEIRVGYRLDLSDRNMSFYVESVSHSWSYPNRMITTLGVTRGQPNNPYPLYVLPPTRGFADNPRMQRRGDRSRLSKFFITPDPIAVRRSLRITKSPSLFVSNTPPTNSVDAVKLNESENGVGLSAPVYGKESVLSSLSSNFAHAATMDDAALASLWEDVRRDFGAGEEGIAAFHKLSGGEVPPGTASTASTMSSPTPSLNPTDE